MSKRIEVRDLDVYYGSFLAVEGVSLNIEPRTVTAPIGPSGCGKSTFIRTLNRMHEVIPGARVEGEVLIDGNNLYGPGVDPVLVRRQVGMVFQRPNPLPISIYDNVVFGLQIHRQKQPPRKELDAIVERALTEVGLWDAVKDRLADKGTTLQLEQQQKLCIARLLPLKPDVILMDEPCSALDVEGTRAIEELMWALAGRYTIVIVTHNMAQARRASHECIFMLMGELIEHMRTEELFLTPQNPKTAEYIEGRYG